MVSKKQLHEARSILTRISAALPERRIPPLSGANLDVDYAKARRLYAQHEQALFDVINELIARGTS